MRNRRAGMGRPAGRGTAGGGGVGWDGVWLSRIPRIPGARSMFKTFVSFKIIMTALRQGPHTHAHIHPDLCLFYSWLRWHRFERLPVLVCLCRMCVCARAALETSTEVCVCVWWWWRGGAALVPVLSAVVILVFVTCITAVFAVHLFSSADQWNFGACAAAALLAPLPPHPLAPLLRRVHASLPPSARACICGCVRACVHVRTHKCTG